MAIQNRRGDFKDFDPYKMVPGEFAIITSGDPNSKDGTSVYHCFAPGVVKRLTSYEDLKEQVDSAVVEIIDERIEEALKDLDISGGGATEEQIEQIETNKQNIENLQQTVDNIKIPAKTSELNNDSGFITSAVNDLANYYLKNQTYSRAEIDNKLSAIPKFSIEVVSSLPTSNISTTTVYLVSTGSETNNLYTEYIYVNNKWEYLGKQTVDLTGYVQKTELSSYYTKTEMESLLTTIRNSIPTKMSQLTEDSTHRTVTDAEKQTWNNKANTATTLAGYGITDGATKEQFDQVQQEIVDLKENGVGAVSAPDFWKNAISTAVSKVKAIQDVGGDDLINFFHFADMHRRYGGTNYTDNIGTVANDAMDELYIPFIFGTGDITESSAASSSEAIDNDVKDGLRVLKPVGLENFVYCKGNHDGAWGAKADYGVNYAMIQHPTKLWNRLYRWQAEDFRRVFSDDGSYFYIDNIPQKVRYIVLNSHWADYSDITDLDYDAQATEYNTQKNINYGDAQAEWLAKVALNFDGEDGWTVCGFTHAPLWNKCNGTSRNYMSVQYAGQNNASTIRGILIGFYNKESNVTYKTGETVDFSNVGENNTIAGVWCGHCHTDLICKYDESGNGTEIPFPIISITSAGNVNSSYEPEFGMPVTNRVLGTDTETALDIVSINKKTKQIYLTRLGAGNDRTTFYGDSTDVIVELLSISANYTGGNVPVGTSLNDLTGITVLAHYSDGTSQAVTEYTISGSISVVGSNTITVSYSGKTATFVVVGNAVEPSIPDVVTNVNVFDSTADGFQDNHRISSSAIATGYITTASSNNQFVTNYIRIDKGMYLNVNVPGSTTQLSTTIGAYFLAYDENKNLIGTYINFSGSVSGNKFKYQVNVDGVAYIRFAPYKTSGSGITVDNCNIVVTTG